MCWGKKKLGSSSQFKDPWMQCIPTTDNQLSVTLVGQPGKRDLGERKGICICVKFLSATVTLGLAGECPCSSEVHTRFWAKGQDVCSPLSRDSAKIHL